MKVLLHYATHNSAIQNLIQVEQKSFFQYSLPYLVVNHQFPAVCLVVVSTRVLDFFPTSFVDPTKRIINDFWIMIGKLHEV